MENIIKVLKERGFIDNMTSHELDTLTEKEMTIYVGFDPTSDSLHLGNLVGIMALAWFQKCGHHPIALVGGATGMIGDPSGKSIERNLLDAEALAVNLEGIRRSLQAVLGSDFTFVNNYDWFGKIGYIDFLRDVGKHFRVGPMLAKESIKSRLASESGISYTEFSYQLLQAYDFLYLHQNHGVNLQMGGSDQWGNITAGTELIRKVSGGAVHGMTWPLLTRSDGKKFGKSEEGAVWLNSDKLPSYDFYQYLFRMPDEDVGKLLRIFTFKELKEIEELEASMKRDSYVPNTAQRILAEDVTRLVHGDAGVEEALRITAAARPGGETILESSTLKAMAQEMPSHTFSREEVLGTPFVELLTKTGMLSSKGEARRMVMSGGTYLNNQKVADLSLVVEAKHLVGDQYILLGVGKKKKVVIEVQ